MQKKEYENQVQINSEHQGSHLHEGEGDDQSNSLQNAKEVTFKQKRMRMKSISKQKTMMTTCTQKKVKIKSNSIQKTKEVT